MFHRQFFVQISKEVYVAAEQFGHEQANILRDRVRATGDPRKISIEFLLKDHILRDDGLHPGIPVYA